MRKIVNIVCLSVVAVLLFATAAFNLFQPNRPTYSEDENRELERFPVFSFASFADSSYFESLGKFISDTFIGRDELTTLSKRMELCFGINGNYAILDVPSDTYVDDTIHIPDITFPVVPETTEPDNTTLPDDTTLPPDTDPHGVVEIILEDASYALNEKDVLAVRPTLRYANEDDPQETLTVTSSNPEIATVVQDGDAYRVTAVSAGKATVTFRAESGVSAVLQLTIMRSATPGTIIDVKDPSTNVGDILPSGMKIYNGAVYAYPSYGPKTSQAYADALTIYTKFFPNSRVNLIIAPISSAMLDNEEYRKATPSSMEQSDMISLIYGKMDSAVHCVDVHAELFDHRHEYIYFKSDHHWTDLGAYYAYRAYAESRGLTPAELSAFREVTLSTDYIGSMYKYTKDERVKGFFDTVDAYIPQKELTMTIYTKDGTVSSVKPYCINTASRGYTAFLTGDQPYTVINVPENPQDMTVLVLKDSFGNAFVPFLTEHYGNIIVVDPRYVGFNIYEALKDYPLTDIIVCTNIYNPNSSDWVKNMLRIVGAQ